MKRRKTDYGRQPYDGVPPPARPAIIPGTRKDLIRLDTRTLRHKALKAYKKAERDLDTLKAQLKRYHEHDVPDFRSWIHKSFGHLLTRQREATQALFEKSTLLLEIRELIDFHGLSELEAYQKALWRRAHPEEAEKEDREQHEKERALFGDDPDDDSDDSMNDDDFSVPDDEGESFDDFFETMTGFQPPSRKKTVRKEDKSAKDLYRTIVRRLHPDHHGQMSDTRKNLWHEAQAAYRRHDAAALYNILARCENGTDGLGDHSPVSLIRHLTRQLKQACQSSRRDIRSIKRDVAWDYENRIRDPRFVRNIKIDLEDAVAAAEHELLMASEILSDFELLAREFAASPRRRQPPCRGSWS